MTVTPTILACSTAADVQAVLRSVSGQSAANFTPSHLCGPMIYRSATGLIWKEELQGHHLYSEGGTAERALSAYTGSPRWMGRTEHRTTFSWAARDASHWSFPDDFAWLLIVGNRRPGLGGGFIGKIRGPADGNGYDVPGPSLGLDRGPWLTSNGGLTTDGPAFTFDVSGVGIQRYSDENGITPQSDRSFTPNEDTLSDGTGNWHDGAPRAFIFGFNTQAVGGPSAYLAGASTAHQISEVAQNCTAESPGDASASDCVMRVGMVEYGFGTPESPFICYGSHDWYMLAAFTGAAAANIHTHANAICVALQATL